MQRLSADDAIEISDRYGNRGFRLLRSARPAGGAEVIDDPRD